MSLAVSFAGLADKGRVRQENEDRWFADPQQGLFIVADGMGGHLGGGLAAEIVIQSLPGFIRQATAASDGLESRAVHGGVTMAVKRLSNVLHHGSRDQLGLDQMGSTVVLALIRDDHALIAHLGDSRAYLLRRRELRQLTQDHTIVQLLLDSGDILPDQVSDHPARGQLTRFVGMPGEPMPDVCGVALESGNRLLLCSDGLTGMVGDADLREILASEPEPEGACRRLIEAANAAGGMDNIAAIVVAADDSIAMPVSLADQSGFR